MTKISCPSLFQSNQDWIVMLRVGKVVKAKKHQLIPGPSHLFGKFRLHSAFDRSRGRGSLESTKVVVKKVFLPSGYLTVCHGKSSFLIGKPSISMAHFPWLCQITGGYLWFFLGNMGVLHMTKTLWLWDGWRAVSSSQRTMNLDFFGGSMFRNLRDPHFWTLNPPKMVFYDDHWVMFCSKILGGRLGSTDHSTCHAGLPASLLIHESDVLP